MIQEVRIASTHNDTKGTALLHEIQRTLGITSISKVHAVKLYRFEGIDEKTAQTLTTQSLIDPLCQTASFNQPLSLDANVSLEVANKPGVMNPEIASLLKTAQSIGIQALKAADTSWEYHFCGTPTQKELERISNRLLVNKTVAHVIKVKPATLIIEGSVGSIATIPLRSMSEDEMLAYAKKNQLAMNAKELDVVKDYFMQIGRDPHDAELETIAQTWSEHCSHKTFKAPLIENGVTKKPLFTRLKETAKKYNRDTVSAFNDNAGVMRFYDGFAIAGKVETHNSPSALEPYGGAATGSGGVFRDIMGTGKGAQVIASTDIFCFAPPTTKDEEVPPGCLHPDYLLRNVVAGVRDYGNRMGIPTNNGSVHFHSDFRAKPTVIVGAYGIMPEKEAQKGVPEINDRIIAVGGKTGRDGIHGATFSSDAMNDQTSTISSTAVQIGNPIEQKRMADALLAARDAGLIHAITDCGAGGFSSAIGEMAQEIGAHVHLEKAPLKYSGLAPWEVWVSESQERMVCAVAPENVQPFIALCAEFNVPATDIGVFTGDQRLLVTYNTDIVCDLSMTFLHDGCPIFPLTMQAPEKNNPSSSSYAEPTTEKEWQQRFLSIMAHENICSKEPIVRQYDHTVQGMNAMAPYTGIAQDGPQNAAILTPLYGKPYGLIISHGLNPILNRIDPYKGSWWAITEALANLVAVGGNPRDVSLIDNFIWPKPNPTFLWALDKAIEACVDAMDAFQIPFISGKDSLSSSYYYPDGTGLHIPPVLCISAFGKIPNVQNSMSSDIKRGDSLLLLIGEIQSDAMGGSLYETIMKTETSEVPTINGSQTAQLFSTMHTLINNRAILSCHDVSEGGMAVAIAEMCIGGKKGATIDLSPYKNKRLDHLMFAETAGCFVVEVAKESYHESTFANIPHTLIGTTHDLQELSFKGEKSLFALSIEEIEQTWKQPMKKVFNS